MAADVANFKRRAVRGYRLRGLRPSFGRRNQMARLRWKASLTSDAFAGT
jgi:hypothetical protein